MCIGSGIGYGNARETAAAPRVIGHIQTVMGGVTLTRAKGGPLQVAVGDFVCQDDIVETAADGLLVIGFIDGTVVNLPGDTQFVLDGYVCGADVSSRPAQLPASRGIFAFIAAQLAKAGVARAETPIASTGMRHHGGGFGLLSLAALTFGIREAQASDPNVTLLDDDNVAYKDLEHGVFELVTKEAVPRHIIVDDPGETVVIKRSGSSVVVSPVGNTSSRMEELQQAQQDVLDLVTKGVGPNGSSTPPFVKALLPQPINFIQTEDHSTPNTLPPLPVVSPIPETPIILPRPPTLTLGPRLVEIDTLVFDTFTATSGTFAGNSQQTAAPLIFGISGGSAGITVLAGVTYDLSETGPYGTLFLNSKTGEYTFVPNSAAINALTAPTVESFVITVSDGLRTTSETFTVAINGTNDTAIISGTNSGAVVEAGGVANAIPGTLTATGLLTDTDVDNPPNTFTVVSSPQKSASGYGSFTMTASGVWTYTLDNTNPAVQALNVGGTLTDSFTVTSIDGTARVVTIVISGTNDAAIVSGATSGSVAEAGGASPGTPTATGVLTDTDVDNTSNLFIALTESTASEHGYGTFTMTAEGVWIYTLDTTNSTVQALNAGGTLTDSFVVTTIDGTSQVVTITINGTNDAAVISGITTGVVIEAGGVANAIPGTPTATGLLTDTDVDNPPNTFTVVSSPQKSASGYGSFTITASGVWTYTLDNTNPAVQALNVGGTLTDSFTVTSIDGTPQVVTIVISGTNDAAIVSGATSGSVTEAGGASPGTSTATGVLTDTDVDNLSNTFTAVTVPTESDHGYGTFVMTADGVWTYTLDNSNSVVQALDVGDTLVDTFAVTTIDGTAVVVTITIVGASDADPNDFDDLATGTVVVSSPPYVFGTPGDDSVAGGGNTAQIVYGGAGNDTLNGTGVDDLIYGGSGNDKIKGNDGDDTIYGGSGNDEINANNGSDVIIGGYGADLLTGGNGDDHFVYLSVADSNATQFDTITDFNSGSDKIDLTAFGSLAFLDPPLPSKTSSVPPHTIAWFYDAAAKQTIVYVNPTDQALTTGDSGLLEIHLQGISSVQWSDFLVASSIAPIMAASEPINLSTTTRTDTAVVGTTTADVSFDTTVRDGTRFADGNWALQAVLIGYGIDAALDRLAWANPGSELGVGQIEHAVHDDEMHPPSGQVVELPHAAMVALMETGFAFKEASVHDKAELMTVQARGEASPSPDLAAKGDVATATIDHGDHRAVLAESTGSTHASARSQTGDADASVRAGDAAASVEPDPDGLEASEAGGANGRSTPSGAASAPTHGSGVHDVEPSLTAHIAFGAAAGDSFHFNNDIGHGNSAAAGGAKPDHAPASFGHHDDIAASHGPPSMFEEAHATPPPLQEFHVADGSAIGSGHSGIGADHAAAIAHAHHDLIV